MQAVDPCAEMGFFLFCFLNSPDDNQREVMEQHCIIHLRSRSCHLCRYVPAFHDDLTVRMIKWDFDMDMSIQAVRRIAFLDATSVFCETWNVSSLKMNKE